MTTDQTEVLQIDAGDVILEGDLAIGTRPIGLVVFAHGSGSSRRSPRNRYVARVLQEKGLATLLFDLLTEEEERIDSIDAHLRFDIPLLAKRLTGVTDWIERQQRLYDLTVGYFGASTGAAAALIAAGNRAHIVRAVVSRGGRPDLARGSLGSVRAPTLLIVGGADATVLDLNRQAMEHLRTEKRLSIIPGASHLFEEHGALEQVARLAADWFVRHLGPTAAAHPPI